ncbi:phage tail tube protein [Methylobacterium sp. SI9]|uniref:phage tail tube protein n=1 Tax=Methylobacterium guangdongense TaxID=3138811 RepID=UPI00313E4758
MGKRIAGTAYITADGVQLALRGNLNVSTSAFERNGIAGLDRVHGYEEKPRVPFIECDVSLGNDTTIAQLEAITDATVVAKLATGRTHTLFGAWTKSAFELNAEQGMTRVRFEGISGSEF